MSGLSLESSRSSTESILTVTTNPCSDVTTNMDSEVVLTDDLVREEEKLAREGEKEEEEELKKRQQVIELVWRKPVLGVSDQV